MDGPDNKTTELSEVGWRNGLHDGRRGVESVQPPNGAQGCVHSTGCSPPRAIVKIRDLTLKTTIWAQRPEAIQ